MADKQPFKTTVFGRRNFYSSRKAFGEDGISMKVFIKIKIFNLIKINNRKDLSR